MFIGVLGLKGCSNSHLAYDEVLQSAGMQGRCSGRKFWSQLRCGCCAFGANSPLMLQLSAIVTATVDSFKIKWSTKAVHVVAVVADRH